MTSKNKLMNDSSDISSDSFHFGQLVWAKLGTAPFWPAVIFAEENHTWFRHRGKLTDVHIYFFGETAERNWVQTTRILPFIGVGNLVKQRRKWHRQMKNKVQAEQKLSLEDKSNLRIAIKQTVNLSKFSLEKRITILKNEWWYWDELNKSETVTEPSSNKTFVHDNQPILIDTYDNDIDEILEIFNQKTHNNDIICLSGSLIDTNDQSSTIQHTSSVCFHLLTSHEEDKIIREMILSNNKSFSSCRCIAEKVYLNCIQKNFPKTTIISEHWFYLFVFRHCHRLAQYFQRWIDDLEHLFIESPFISPLHSSQMKSIVILFKQYNDSNQ